MFGPSVRYYDAIYTHDKDYPGEARALAEAVLARAPHAKTLLDVGCGTGLHLEHLAAQFDVAGVELDAGLVAAGCARNPALALHQGDMRTFAIGQRFDCVTCLFSAIAYVANLKEVRQSVARMVEHLSANGLMVIEPWFPPDRFTPGRLWCSRISGPDLEITRMCRPRVQAGRTILEMHHLCGTPDGIESFVETHELLMLTTTEMTEALEAAGLEVEHDPVGLTGRGLYYGRRVN